MRQITTVVLVLLPLFLISCGDSVGDGAIASGPPTLSVVGGDTIDWGDVGGGELAHELQLVNAGGDTLKIEGIKPSCGCTTAPIDKSEIGPGDTARVAVTMDVASRTGSTSKTITITSSDSANPTHIITLKANIVREIFAEPNYFAIAGIEPGKSGTSSVILRNNGSTPVKLDPPKLVGSTLMKVDFDMTEPTTIGAGDSLALSATVTPLNNAPEPVTYSLATDNPKNKEVRVTVNVSTAPVLN